MNISRRFGIIRSLRADVSYFLASRGKGRNLSPATLLPP